MEHVKVCSGAAFIFLWSKKQSWNWEMGMMLETLETAEGEPVAWERF